MSRWTHVNGSFEFEADPHEFKKTKSGKETVSLPFPAEQFVLGLPEHFKDKMSFNVYLYSLPRVKPLFKKWVGELMPQGETGFTYYLNQRKGDFRSSSSEIDFPCDQKLFKRRLSELYKNDDELKYYYEFNPELFDAGWTHTCSTFAFTVSDDIRGCSGYRLMQSFENLFTEIEKAKVFVNRGVIEWTDEYEPDLVFSIHAMNSFKATITFSIFDKKKNCYIAKKTLKYDFKQSRYLEKKSDNWDDLMPKSGLVEG